MINIEGLDKADVLAVLYNTSRPKGMGFIQAGAFGPFDMTREQAQHVLDAQSNIPNYQSPFYFDYLYGRPLKVDLTSDVELDERHFDDNNTEHGTAAEAIDHLRTTGNIHCPDGSSFTDDQMNEEDSMMFMIGALQAANAG